MKIKIGMKFILLSSKNGDDDDDLRKASLAFKEV